MDREAAQPVETPNIDRIAAAGVRFARWHTTALCSPTRSCLLTGRNHTRNSMACITEAACVGRDSGAAVTDNYLWLARE